MKSEHLADLRTALLYELYRVQPLGRPVNIQSWGWGRTKSAFLRNEAKSVVA